MPLSGGRCELSGRRVGWWQVRVSAGLTRSTSAACVEQGKDADKSAELW